MNDKLDDEIKQEMGNKESDKSTVKVDKELPMSEYNWDSLEDIQRNINYLIRDLSSFLYNLNYKSLNENFKSNLGWFKLSLALISYILVISIASTLFKVTSLIPGFNYLLYAIGLYEFASYSYKPLMDIFSTKVNSENENEKVEHNVEHNKDEKDSLKKSRESRSIPIE